MKHTTVTARSLFRVLLVITALFAVFALTFSASAANTLTDAKMTYDFSSYSSLLDITYDEANADKGGWKVSCTLPDGATTAPAVVINAASVGCSDYSTRRGEICSDITLTYVVPAADRISVKDYDLITYTRALVFANGFARSGSQYSITFVMDDGQTVEITRDWIDGGTLTVDKTEVSVFVGDMFDALEGTPVLEKIEYRPYVKPEEFMVSAAVEQNSLIQFLTSFMTFETLTPAPTYLSVVADDYNGQDILTHNGKITNLDILKTYEYKLTYADEWIRVSGVNEITGLTGAAYRVRVLPDSNSPYAASYPIAIVVPRTTYTPFSYVKERVNAGDFISAKSDTAQMGVWTSPTYKPYNAVGRLTIGCQTTALNGSLHSDGGHFYRREQLIFEYILKPEEQMDVSDAIFSFSVICSGSFPYSSREDVSGQMRIYVSSQEEPIILDNIVHGYDELGYQFNFSKNLPELTGNVEKIEYIPFYEQYADAVVHNNYPQIVNVQLVEIEPPRAPSVVIVELSEGRYKILGLNASVQYEISRDMITWTDIEKGVSGVEVAELGNYYIRQKENELTMAGDIAVATVKKHVEAPENITVSGKSIVGLDASKTYEYVSYDMFANDYTRVTGVTSISSLTPGLWAIRYAEGENTLPSDNLYLLIEGSSEKGKVTRQAQKDASLRGFAVGELSSDVRQVSLYTAMKDPNHFVMYGGWTKTTDMIVNAELNVKYAFTSEQAFDIKDLYKFSYKAWSSNGFYLNGGSYAGFYNKIRFHVVGSDAEYYDVLVPWNGSGKLSPNVADLLPAHAHGYVVGYTFFYYGAWPEISDEVKSSYPYPTFYLYDMTLSSKVSAPKPSISCDANGTFTISGLSSSYAHGYTTDKVNYTEIAKGKTSFTVTKPGTYYVYAEDTTGKKSEVVAIEAVLPSTISTSGLSVTGNAITGLKDYLSYEYRKVSFGESAGEFMRTPEGATQIPALSTGVWEVRHITGGNTISASQYLLVGGNHQGSLSHKAVYTVGGEGDDGVRGFVENRWTSSVSYLYYDSFTSADAVRLATNWTSSTEQAELDKFYYSYQFSEDEIVAAGDMGAISFRFGTGISWPYSNKAFVSRVRYYVIGSDVEYYDELVSSNGDYAIQTSNLSAIAGVKGYVVAIKIWPLATLPEGTTIVNSGNRFPVIKFNVVDTGNDDIKLKYRINFKDMKPSGITVEEENTDLFRRYKITGLNASKGYEFSYDGISFSAVTAGSTEINGLVGGTYFVRYAGSNTAVKLITPAMTPAFTDKTVSKFPCVVSPDTSYEGMWNTYPGKLELSENYITTRIYSDTVLNTATYNYTFNKEHQFKVYENPIFTADFNNELINMNMPKAFIEGAVAKVEIYFEETEKPFTLTWNWVGKTLANGATPNKYTVNLLEIAPELSNLTVKAFKLIPYSNIDLTPNDYNTSAANDRYMDFRLFNIGFMSTPANVASLMDGTYAEVNQFTGVAVENFPETLSVGEKIDLDTIVVKATYSDETYTELEKHMYSVSALSFDKAGRYVVEISYRNKSVLKEIDVDFDVATLKINTLPTKTLYVVGESFVKSGLTISFKTPDGIMVVVDDGFTVTSPAFDTVGTKTVSIEYADATLTFEVNVISADNQIKLVSTSTLTIDSVTKRIKGVAQNTTVEEFLQNFEQGVAVVDRSGSLVSDTTVLVGTGFAVITYDENGIYDKAEVIVRGDINGNGKIDTNDYLMIKRACIGTINIVDGSAVFEAADVNANGSLDSNDYVQIKNHYRGRINIFE